MYDPFILCEKIMKILNIVIRLQPKQIIKKRYLENIQYYVMLDVH